MNTHYAPAKLNLFLHVIGKKEGYHTLESMVVFVDLYDELQIDFSKPLQVISSINIPNNLCIKAMQWATQQAHIVLTKRIPMGAGLGGGSADAAACLRAIEQQGYKLPKQPMESIGADVPVCYYNQPAWMTGIGEHITPISWGINPVYCILINPGYALKTEVIFSVFHKPFHKAISKPPQYNSLVQWIDFLRQYTENDLWDAAISVYPSLGSWLLLLEKTNPILSRMTGSGSTVFALYETQTHQQDAFNWLQHHISPKFTGNLWKGRILSA